MHPIINYEFDSLLPELRKRKRYIYEKTNGNLVLFNYNDNAMYDNKWDELICMCRGLIIDIDKKKIVAIPFYKFFNVGEKKKFDKNEEIGECKITEKLDGSLGIIYFYDNKWRVSTRGSFNSPQSKWAQEYLDKQNYNLIEGNTYLVEIIYKQNKIVCNYNFEGLFLLSANDKNGNEIYRDNLIETGISLVKMFDFPPTTKWQELYDFVNTFSSDIEGIVINKDNLRLKLKGKIYTLQHKSLSKITPLYVWECLKLGEHINYPEEFEEDINKMKTILTSQFNKKKDEIIEIKHLISNIENDKDVHNILKENKISRIIGKNTLRRHLSDEDFINLSISNAIWNEVRPTGNKLLDYN